LRLDYAFYVRVALLFNGQAGAGVSLDRIRGAIEKQDHDLVCVVEAQEDVKRVLEKLPDLIVAAGGDGTVALAARVIARRGIPLAILPLGTANNIARSLAIQGSIDDLVGAWDTATRVPVDVGAADGSWGRHSFVEAVGTGLFPTAMADMDSRSDGDGLPPPEKVAGAIRAMGKVLSKLQPVEMTIVADGVRTSGAFLLAEVLNMPSIGPNLVFAADATPSDGLLHVVLAGEEHRDEIARYLQELIIRRDAALALPSTRARRVTLQSASDIHLDDDVMTGSSGRIVSMQIDEGALEVLI
jgi:diacylglycerol kinase family enzyme